MSNGAVAKQFFEIVARQVCFFSERRNRDGYSLLFSTLVTKEKSLAYAYGLTFIFYELDVIAGLSDKLSWTKHLSLFHLFKPQEVLDGTVNPTGVITGLSIST